jgi:hypothetical protein
LNNFFRLIVNSPAHVYLKLSGAVTREFDFTTEECPIKEEVKFIKIQPQRLKSPVLHPRPHTILRRSMTPVRTRLRASTPFHRMQGSIKTVGVSRAQRLARDGSASPMEISVGEGLSVRLRTDPAGYEEPGAPAWFTTSGQPLSHSRTYSPSGRCKYQQMTQRGNSGACPILVDIDSEGEDDIAASKKRRRNEGGLR